MAHGYDEDTKQKCLGMALDKHRLLAECLCGLLAENDFGKLLNFVVADGQTCFCIRI